MRVVAVALALALAGSTLNPLAVMAHTPMRFGYFIAPTSQKDGEACVSWTRVWLQELASSGVVRLKARFERRGPNDPGIPGLSYETRGWYYSTRFPDDERSLYVPFSAYFRHFPGGIYKIRAILVGERPGFWRPDHKLKVDLTPEIGCESGITDVSG